MYIMETIKLDGNKLKRCAFCKYWYDPTNQYIKPHIPQHGYWKFEPYVRCKCLKTNLDSASQMNCSKFENKLL